MKKVDWQVEGMTCSNCALSVTKYLQKKGMQEVKVDPISGNVSFEVVENNFEAELLKKGIKELGYQVSGEKNTTDSPKSNILPKNNKDRFLITLPFTLILMTHMLHGVMPIHWIMNPYIQLILCLPVFFIGIQFFGISAWKSIRSGVPNMNVLVALGGLVSFLYSIIGMFILKNPDYLFFETTASIFTLVFLGNYLEESTMKSTQRALISLTRVQVVKANMIAFDDQHQEQIFEIENTALKTGDLILIKTGEQVPADCKILSGSCNVNESIITGESLPKYKTKKDLLIGGSYISDGTIKAQVTATGNDTVLSGIIQMVKRAQSEKPPVQQLADRISAVFVPTVLIIAVICFLLNYFWLETSAVNAVMRSIAVLVISCPCAMGLATPAAISVGLGRAAGKGIIYRNAAVLESFRKIKQVVFDKTGTLTTGQFNIRQHHSNIDEQVFRSMVVSLEKHSNHPIAASIVENWKDVEPFRWKQVTEIKGIGMLGKDLEENIFEVGSVRLLENQNNSEKHTVYVLKNKSLIGWIDVEDTIRPEAIEVISWLKNQQIKVIMLTGDLNENAIRVAEQIGIREIYAEQSPDDKLKKITALNEQMPTAMIGDGVNDAPALAKATIGISLGHAAQLSIQHADVILLNHGLKLLPEAIGLGKHTYQTIQQNLFWAFSYNIIAIPIAVFGWLTPAFAAMAMGFSDVMLAIISLRLKFKKYLNNITEIDRS